MATEELEQRLEDIGRIATAVNMFDSFELQLAAFSYLTRGSALLPPTVAAAIEEAEAVEEEILDTVTVPQTAPSSPLKAPRKRTAKKTTVTLDKSLDLYPSGEPSFIDFANEKEPKTNIPRVVVTVYWLREYGNVDAITPSHIYTCFKAINWPVPLNIPNTLAKAGGENYVDSSKSEAIKLTTHGENYIEHALPLAKA
ncbi:hypothetical protein [Pseudarthrobacter sp.]|uniref:hypothetical protein n=1 Tax=Pseudarthrobacter sp. TaxID=1934409 RepID=UPI002FC65D1C